MRNAGFTVGLLALVGLALAWSQVEGEEVLFEVEGYGFGLRDLRVEPNTLIFSSISAAPIIPPPPQPQDPFELEGLGVRLKAAVDLPGQRGRLEARYQKTQDSDDFLKTVFPIEFSGTARLELTAFDLGWSGLLIHDGPWRLRGEMGYRYLRADQDVSDITTVDECYYITVYTPCGRVVSTLDSESQIRGHGLRAGWELSVAVGGPLYVETLGGFGLLRGSEKGRESSSFEFEPGLVTINEEDIDRDSIGLNSWDLSVRLRAEFLHHLSASFGYRFDRWESISRLPSTANLSFDGVTAGLGYRFGM